MAEGRVGLKATREKERGAIRAKEMKELGA